MTTRRGASHRGSKPFRDTADNPSEILFESGESLLPDLHPVHDGSYGLNTLAALRQGPAGIVSEEAEDEQFRNRLGGRTGSRLTMEGNLDKVLTAANLETSEAPVLFERSMGGLPQTGQPKQVARADTPKRPRTRETRRTTAAQRLPDTSEQTSQDRQAPPKASIELPADQTPNEPTGDSVSLRAAKTRAGMRSLNKAKPPDESAPPYGVPTGVGPAASPGVSSPFKYEGGLFGASGFGLGLKEAQRRAPNAANGQSSPLTAQKPPSSQQPQLWLSALDNPDAGSNLARDQSYSLKKSVQSGRSDDAPEAPQNLPTATSPSKSHTALSSTLGRRNTKSPRGRSEPVPATQGKGQSAGETASSQWEYGSSSRSSFSSLNINSNGSQSTAPTTPDAPPFASPNDLKGFRISKKGHLYRKTWATRVDGWVRSLIAWALLLGILSCLASVAYRSATDETIQWYGWHYPKHNLVQFLPEGVRNFNPLGSDEASDLWRMLRLQESNAIRLQNNDDAMKTTIEVLQKEIPQKIHVTKDKKGKLQIPDDFWHAVRELAKADDFILSLIRHKGQPPQISPDHWLAIKQRLESDPTFAKKNDNESSGLSVGDLENYMTKHLPKHWQKWLDENSHKIKENSKGETISKADFMGLLRSETAEHQREIKEELGAVNEQIKDIMAQVQTLRSGQSRPSGLTKNEVQAVAQAVAQKVINSANLDAIASGKIKGHASEHIFNQVNLFSMGSGAVIDPTLSASAWVPPSHKAHSKEWRQTTRHPKGPSTALQPWSEESECFCAKPDKKSPRPDTYTIAVMTSRRVVPQHLVVEHILPGATLDPDAMPRELEVWGSFEEVKLRNEAQALSASLFPATMRETVLDERFVKLGQGIYEQRGHGDGVQIIRLSPEWSNMRAATSHIVVRAVSNYGADHTCFYRLRLYGDIIDWGTSDDTPVQDMPPQKESSERRWFGF